MKRFYFIMISLLAVTAGWSQTTYTWQGGNGASWTTSTNWTPTRTSPANSDRLIFNTGTTLSVINVPTQTIGRLSILSGSITLNGAANATTLTIGGSTGDDLIVAEDATMTQASSLETITFSNNSSSNVAGALVVEGTFNANSNSSSITITATGSVENRNSFSTTSANRTNFNGGSSYFHARNGGDIPTATWSITSNCHITGITSNGPASGTLAQDFGNFIWNSPLQTAQYSMAGNLDNVSGNFEIVNTGSGDIRFKNSTSGFFPPPSTTVIDGDLKISGGTLNIVGTSEDHEVYVSGNFIMTGGTLTETGADISTILFNMGTQTFTKTGGVILNTVRFEVVSGSTLDFGTSVLDGSNARFTLASGAAIATAHNSGLSSSGATGSIQVGGTRTYSSTANYEFRGASTGSFSTSGNNVNSLIINRVGGEVVAARDFIVNGALTLTNGYLTTSATNTVTIGGSGTASTSNGAFVNGPLIVTRTSTAAITLPVGTVSGGLRTIGITPNNTNSTTTFTAQAFRSSPQSLPNGTVYGSGISKVSGCEYWTLVRNSGSRNANVTLSWSAQSNCSTTPYVTELSSLRVARLTGTSWVNAGPGTGAGMPSTITAGTITSDVQTTFGTFALATTTSSENPLPVMFSDVRAFSKNAGVQIEWSNLTERDIQKYTVERSSNGIEFTEISMYAPKSNRDDKASYDHFDAVPFNGANFYRVKVYENGGKIIYSKILRVETGNTKTGFNVYPNPVTGNQLTVSLNGVGQGKYAVSIAGSNGQQVYRTTIMNAGNGTSQMIELPASVKPGVYNVTITDGQFRSTKMIIVQ